MVGKGFAASFGNDPVQILGQAVRDWDRDDLGKFGHSTFGLVLLLASEQSIYQCNALRAVELAAADRPIDDAAVPVEQKRGG